MNNSENSVALTDAFARPWILEDIVLVDELTGEDIGSVDREKAHKEGLWHASVHVWIIEAKGRLLFQQRADWIHAFPNQWDISAAGHLKVGEENAFREVSEELGVRPNDGEIVFLGTLLSSQDGENFTNRERPRVYLWISSLRLQDFSFPDGEVQALVAIERTEIQKFISGGSVMAEVLRDGAITLEPVSGTNLVPQSNGYWAVLWDAVEW